MFNFIKSYIEDYKTYKIEKAQDDLMLEESLAKHRADMEKELLDVKLRMRRN